MRTFIQVSLTIIALVVSACLGYAINEVIKPTIPDVGSIDVVGSWNEEEGNLYCFSEESFDNLADLLVAMSEEFKGVE